MCTSSCPAYSTSTACHGRLCAFAEDELRSIAQGLCNFNGKQLQAVSHLLTENHLKQIRIGMDIPPTNQVRLFALKFAIIAAVASCMLVQMWLSCGCNCCGTGQEQAAYESPGPSQQLCLGPASHTWCQAQQRCLTAARAVSPRGELARVSLLSLA